MTDQPPGNPGDVWATGQRRAPDGLFPQRGGGGGGGGGGGDDGETHQQEVGDEDPTPGVYVDPCSNLETRKIWNADAAAAAGAPALIAKAASLNDGSNLSNREFGANLFLNSAGQVDITEIDVGPLAVIGDVPDVEILPHGTTYQNWMGDIHNHPSGIGMLSANERNLFNARIDKMMIDVPSRTDALGLAAYVVVLDPTAPQGYKIYAHTRQTGSDELGEEVNPDAQPCPSV